MFSILILAVLLLIAVLFLVVYYMIYTKKINQRVCEGNTKVKRMPDFHKATIVVIIILLLSVCVVNAFTPAATTISRNNYAVIDTSDYSYMAYSSNVSLDDASFARLFSEDGNDGYTREEFQDGDFHFIVFTAKTPSDSFHPDFLCYIVYIGDVAAAMSLNGQFLDPITDTHVGDSTIFDYKNQTLLIVGNYDKDSKFVLKMGAYDDLGYKNYLDSTDTDEAMESFAISVGSVLIEND